MILSHKHRFVFIKTRKTAGSSLQAYLREFCDPKQDIITGQNRGEGSNWNFLGTPFEHPRKPNKGWGHMRLAEVLSHCPEARGYFTFAVERNSWDKVVSYYFFSSDGYRGGIEFKDFVRTHSLPVDWIMYARDSRTVGVDMLIQYADLERAIPELGERLGLPLTWEGMQKYRHKGHLRPEGIGHRGFYDDETRGIVARRYRREIRAFNYEP